MTPMGPRHLQRILDWLARRAAAAWVNSSSSSADWMACRQPATHSIGELAEVEPVLQHVTDGVFGERVTPAVAGGSVAGSVQCLGDLSVTLPLSRELEGHQQAGIGLGIRDRQPTLSMLLQAPNGTTPL